MQVKEWKKNIRTVVPYIPGEQPKEENVIKLNTNENPYPPSKKVMDKLKEIENLRLYPDPSAKLLVDEIAKHFHVNSNQVFVGVGSDDVLAMAFLTFFNGKNPIFFPDITYSFYDVWAELFRIPYEKQALDSEFRIKKEDYYKENGGIVSYDLLHSVNDYMQREDIRVLTDTIQIVACELIDVSVKAKIRLMSSTPLEFLQTIKSSFQNAFNRTAGLGVSFSRSWIISNLFVDGVKDVQLLEPAQDITVSETACARLIKVELTL